MRCQPSRYSLESAKGSESKSSHVSLLAGVSSIFIIKLYLLLIRISEINGLDKDNHITQLLEGGVCSFLAIITLATNASERFFIL